VLPAIPATALVATLLVVAPWALPSHASVLGACNPIDPPPSPGGLNVPYKTISAGELVLDVYRPPGAGPFPAIVLAHGGGYRSGCKGKTASEARFIADQGFVTFNISYRLACDEAHPPPDVQDPGVECWGPGVAGLSNRDMRDAVA
jgi:acetyl esterase/lipase